MLHYDTLPVALLLPHPNVTLSGQSTLWQEISSVFTCSLWSELPEICHDICHSLCGFCRWSFFSCLKQLFYTCQSALPDLRISTAYLPIFCSKCEVFKVGNLFFIVLLIKALFLTALILFRNQMHLNTSGCRQSSCMSSNDILQTPNVNLVL